MLVRRTARDPRQNRPLVRWLRRVQAWREDHDRRAAARAEARARAPMEPGERLLAVARGASGDVLAATDWALYHQASHGWARLGWEQVGRVDWDEQRRVLRLTGLTPTVPARTVLRLAKNWGLPAVAVERVGRAKVVDQRISLNGGAGARVIARRRPGGVRVAWLVIVDRGLNPADPGIRAELQAALTELRAVTGVGESDDSEPPIAQP